MQTTWCDKNFGIWVHVVSHNEDKKWQCRLCGEVL